MTSPHDIAIALSSYRTARRLSLRRAAEAIGVLPSTLHRIEHAEVVMGPTLLKVANWLAERRRFRKAARRGNGGA